MPSVMFPKYFPFLKEVIDNVVVALVLQSLTFMVLFLRFSDAGIQI